MCLWLKRLQLLPAGLAGTGQSRKPDARLSQRLLIVHPNLRRNSYREAV
jgi:hypothetical protein